MIILIICDICNAKIVNQFESKASPKILVKKVFLVLKKIKLPKICPKKYQKEAFM